MGVGGPVGGREGGHVRPEGQEEPQGMEGGRRGPAVLPRGDGEGQAAGE